jgi:hypothetical protein
MMRNREYQKSVYWQPLHNVKAFFRLNTSLSDNFRDITRDVRSSITSLVGFGGDDDEEEDDDIDDDDDDKSSGDAKKKEGKKHTKGKDDEDEEEGGEEEESKPKQGKSKKEKKKSTKNSPMPAKPITYLSKVEVEKMYMEHGFTLKEADEFWAAQGMEDDTAKISSDVVLTHVRV